MDEKSHSPAAAHLKARLQQQAVHSRLQLALKHPHIVPLLHRLKFTPADMRRHAVNLASAAAIAGGVLTMAPKIGNTIQPSIYRESLSREQLAEILRQELARVLTPQATSLSPATDIKVAALLKDTLDVDVTAQLDGNQLLTSYGYIGQEQHLPRYPGDSISQHSALQQKGMTSGRGGFGYFTYSRNTLTATQKQEEEYYIAVPLMYLPNWKEDLRYLVNWYKFRKVLVVNPRNGKAVAAVIGDAGPAAWTGKQFGGSPELMDYLNLQDGQQKGKVLVFFVDESQKPLALGPINTIQGSLIAQNKL